MEFQPADILLMTRTDNVFMKCLCETICLLDNFHGLPSVCHAAILDEDLNTVGMEAEGLLVQSMDSLLAKTGHCYLYRYKVETCPWYNDLAPVIDRIEYYKDKDPPYAYMDYALLPFIVLSRKIALDTLSPLQQEELREVIDECCLKIEENIRLYSDSMICSELVYRCYDESRLHPVILGTEQANNTNLFTDKQQMILKQLFGEVVPNWVTPGDLISSPSLSFVNQLK